MQKGTRLAIIGGSAVEQLRGFATAQTVRHTTPWGEPSAPVHTGAFFGVPALYLARHGEPHAIAPHRINYRANLRALADLGATHVVALNTVGGIAPAATPASLWLPHDAIDYTWGREGSFHDGVLLGYACLRAHWPDVGSATPGIARCRYRHSMRATGRFPPSARKIMSSWSEYSSGVPSAWKCWPFPIAAIASMIAVSASEPTLIV